MTPIRIVTPEHAFYLNKQRTLRTSFLSDVELQSYAGDTARMLYGIANLIKLREKILDTEKEFIKHLPQPIPKIFMRFLQSRPIPPPCPIGIWDWKATHKCIIDDSNFKVQDFRIEYDGKNIVKEYTVKPIIKTKYQLLEADILETPTFSSPYRSELPRVNLIFEGIDKSDILAGNSVSIALNNLPIIPPNSVSLL